MEHSLRSRNTMPNAYRPELWHDLYVALCGASAALAGLLFIATSLHIHAIAKDPVLRIRAAANTFLIFLLVIEAALVLIPQETTALATEICFCAALLLASFAWTRARRHRIGRTFSRRGLLHPLLFLIGMGGGLSLLFRSGGGMYIVTAQFLAALCFVMFNAWSLLIAASEEEPST